MGVAPSHDASKVKAEGPGLSRSGRVARTCTYARPSVPRGSSVPDRRPPLLAAPPPGVESGKPTHFTVLTKGAGKAPVDVSFSSPVRDYDVIDNYDYSQTVKYTPAQQVRRRPPRRPPAETTRPRSPLCPQGELTIVVTFGGDAIAKSPFVVGVAAPLDLDKVNVDDLDGRKKRVWTSRTS